MKGVRSRKISGAASPVVQLFGTSWGVPYCLRRILRQSQAAAVCIAGEPRHAHLTEQGKLGWARENDGRCNGRSGTRRRSNRCSGVVSALVTVGGFTAGNYTEVQLLDISVVKLGATFDTASHSTENCMSVLVNDFKCLVDSVESQVSTVQWCYTKKTSVLFWMNWARSARQSTVVHRLLRVRIWKRFCKSG